MGQARLRQAEIAKLKSVDLVVDLDKVDIDNITDINTFVKSVSGCDDRFLELMKQLTGNDPEIVRVVEFGGKPLQCIENAHMLNNVVRGECVRGWQILLSTNKKYERLSELNPSDDPSLARTQRRFGFQEINQHMLVRDPEFGQLWDSSPSISAGMPDQFRIFWQDDKLLTKDALDYEMVDDVYTWGMNYCYLPVAGRSMLRLNNASDIQHIQPGELCPIRLEQPKGRQRDVDEHIRRNGVAMLQRSFA